MLMEISIIIVIVENHLRGTLESFYMFIIGHKYFTSELLSKEYQLIESTSADSCVFLSVALIVVETINLELIKEWADKKCGMHKQYVTF